MKRLLCIFGEGMAVLVLLFPSVSFASTLKSNNYQFVENSLGGNGFVGSQSLNYQASGSGAILGLGNSTSASYQVNAGNTTTNDPALSFGVTSGSVNFSNFSTATAATATSTFDVIDYTSYGYSVIIFGNPPSNGSHTIAPMSSLGPSQIGVEQFGINLVANTSPVSLGANPNHGQFGFGSAVGNYGTPNDYYYSSGDTIASSSKSSGETIYTISYIVNVSSLTPGGEYTSGQTLLCVGTY